MANGQPNNSSPCSFDNLGTRMNNWLNYHNHECLSCPFNLTEESEMAYNLGCLPTPQDLLTIKRDSDDNWECHEGTGKICAGFVAACRDTGLDYRSGKLVDSALYLQTGKIAWK